MHMFHPIWYLGPSHLQYALQNKDIRYQISDKAQKYLYISLSELNFIVYQMVNIILNGVEIGEYDRTQQVFPLWWKSAEI